MKITSAKTEIYTADKARRSFPAMSDEARRLKIPYIDQYVRDMNAGQWVSNPMAPICVVTLPDGTEVLANGNHRVAGLYRSDAKVSVFVIRVDMSQEEYALCVASCDIGAGRSYSDSKPLTGLVNTQTVLYALRLQDAQDDPAKEYAKNKYSPFTMKAFEVENEAILNEAIAIVKQIKNSLGGAKISYASLGATYFYALANGWSAEELVAFSTELGKAWIEMVQRGQTYLRIDGRGSSRSPALKQQYILDCLVAFGDNDDLPVEIDTELRADGLFLGRISL